MCRTVSAAVMAILAMAALGSAVAPGPVLAQDEAESLTVVPATVIVDDLSDGFRPVGSGWRASAGGYVDHHYWLRAKRTLGRIGVWNATLEEPGLYRVLAKLPRWHASTRGAIYKVKTADGWARRIRNQSKHRGDWVSLGKHVFSTEAEVRLGDQTLDPRGARRKVAFDALKFVPAEPPPPPVITRLDVDPRHDRAIVTFSLEAAGPANAEYRRAGTSDWLSGASETSSAYADHRQVIRRLEPETEYELRVIATNSGGRTISPIIGFTTLAPPPPVIKDIVVRPEDSRAVVTFSLGEKGPAKTEYRRVGSDEWFLGAEETSSKYADHRQVIRGIQPERRYELRVNATNAGGTTTSPIERFTTQPRTVDCDAGQDLQAAIDVAREGDTVLVSGTCRGNYVVGTDNLTLKGLSAGATLQSDGTIPVITVGEELARRTLSVVGLSVDGGGIAMCGGLDLRDVTVVGGGISPGCVQTWVSVEDSVIRDSPSFAIATGMQGSVEVIRSLIRDNGGGIASDNVRVIDSTIQNNAGRGIDSAGPELFVRGSQIVGNHSVQNGGGIVYGGLGAGADDVYIEDTVIRGNTTSGSGGGFYRYPGGDRVHFTNVEIRGNSAQVDGGGIYNAGDTLILSNVTFGNNTPNDCVGC
jgi:hypothetical protein